MLVKQTNFDHSIKCNMKKINNKNLTHSFIHSPPGSLLISFIKSFFMEMDFIKENIITQAYKMETKEI